MALENLCIVQQSTNGIGSGRQIFRLHSHQLVDGFGGSEVMAHGTDTTETLHECRRFPIGMSLNEALEAAEFNDVKEGIFHLAVIIEMQGNPAMSFHARNRIDNYFFTHDQSYLNSEYRIEKSSSHNRFLTAFQICVALGGQPGMK